MGDLPPSEARSLYLNGRSLEEKAAILERAAQSGPGPEDADWLIALAAESAANRIEAVAARVPRPSALGPEALAAIEAAVAKGAASTEQLREMASDLRAIRARVWSTQATSRWLMFGVFVAGLVVAFACALLLHFAGHRSQGQIWIAADGLARLSEVLACVVVFAAGVTWWATRR